MSNKKPAAHDLKTPSEQDKRVANERIEELDALLEEWPRYADFLRPEAALHFVIVTDDDSDLPAQDFKRELDRLLGRPYTVKLVTRYIGENLLWLALGLPLALWGIVCHAAPYWLTGVAAGMLGSTAEEEGTDKMAAGAVLHPLLWIAEGWIVWRLGGVRALVAFTVLLVPSGLLALAWRERLGEVARQARAFFRFLGDRDLHRALMGERQALVEEVRALAARVSTTAPPAPGGADAR